MKKIILSTTALVLSAGLANAQAVSIGGEGRMGIIAADFGGITAWAIENRLQLDFSVSVEADHGLSFGAFTRARMQMGGAGIGGFPTNQPGVFSGSRVWVEANSLRLTFGNVGGAIDGFGYIGGWGIGYTGGLIGGDTAGVDRTIAIQGFRSAGAAQAQRVRLEYAFGDSAVAISGDRGGSLEVAGNTTFGAISVAAGYTDGAAGPSSWTISGAYDAGSWSAGAIVANNGVTGNTNYSLSASASVYGGTLYGYVGQLEGLTAYGANYAYDLGGGAEISVGAERVGPLTAGAVGVVFSF